MMVYVSLRIKELCEHFQKYFKENIEYQRDKCCSGKTVIRNIVLEKFPSVKKQTTHKIRQSRIDPWMNSI